MYTNEEEVQHIIRITPSTQHITTTIMHQVLSKHISGLGSAMKYHILEHNTLCYSKTNCKLNLKRAVTNTC